MRPKRILKEAIVLLPDEFHCLWRVVFLGFPSREIIP